MGNYLIRFIYNVYMTNFFVYDNVNNRLELNEPELLLIKEFKELLERDKTKNKVRFWKELTYIYLAICWKSPYNQYSSQEKHVASLEDSGLTENEFNDPIFRNACRKFRNLQESNKSIKMLEAAKGAVDKFIDYFDIIVDLNERDTNGKPIFSAEKIMKEVSNLTKVHQELIDLENQVKKELTEKTTLRAGANEDFDPGDF